MINGGSGWSTFAESCLLRIERRTIPGETGESVLAEIRALCAEIAAVRSDFDARCTLVCAQPPSDLATDAPLTRAMVETAQRHALAGAVDGLPCWTDAALLNAAGIPALCFGPGDIGRAHSAEEWVECEQLEQATSVLEDVCATWGR
jgi:acetylornithine deacetylase